MARTSGRVSAAAMALWKRRHPEWADGHRDRVTPRLQVSAAGLPRYALDRARVAAGARGPGRRPWITAGSRRLLEGLLRPDDVVLEFGAGGTTPWFARRAAKVVSVEAFPRWYRPLRAELDAAGVGNVDLHLVSADELGYETPQHRAAYVGVAPELEPGSVDVVFVDGEYRDECAARGLRLLAPGGFLVLDNAELYTPSTTRSPWRVDEPATPLWGDVLDELAHWRRITTTNGVWDTVVWIRPGT